MAHTMAVAVFESQLQKAMDRVRMVLAEEKVPTFASGTHHQYQDKFLLAEFMTNTAIASQLNCLAALGVTAEHLETLRGWSASSLISLRFRSEERCFFLREETKEVENPTKHVTELSIGGAAAASWTSKVVTTVTEYFWNFETYYELFAMRGVGSDPSDVILIQSRHGKDTLVTSTKSSPRPEARVPACNFEVSVAWLFKNFGEGARPSFGIDRQAPKCHTPRRNKEVEDGITHFRNFNSWCTQVCHYMRELLAVQTDPTHRPDFSVFQADNVLVPVLPLLSERPAAIEDAPAPQGEGVLSCLAPPSIQGMIPSIADINKLVAEEVRQLAEVRSSMLETFRSGENIATAAEAIIAYVVSHCVTVGQRWMEAMAYIENMIRKQLIDAIGKEVSPADFAEYMRFHNRKLFAEAYQPVPFCYAVRRSEKHSPEGTVSIEEDVVGPGGDSNIPQPIVTVVAKAAARQSMNFPLGAATTITFNGDRYLHAWLRHQFSGQSGNRLQVVTKSRQFSSYLVLVGRIASPTSFDPKYAAIIQNKDELTIPLDLSTIPTPKEFKDAISSLSPEAQAFAKAFRAMQLESTLFGVLVIQIKPQLERVLNLPEDSLTKEIKLTQELMQLFIKYQIPSDLLSYSEDTPGAEGVEVVGVTSKEKLEAVKGHVKAMQDMINQAKEEEIAERRQEAAYINPLAGMGMAGMGAQPFGFEASMAACSFSAMPQACSFSAMPQAISSMPVMDCAFGDFACEAAAPPVAAAECFSFSPAPAPPPAAPPAPAQPTKEAAPSEAPKPEQPAEQGGEAAGSGGARGGARDYTQVPKELDARFAKQDTDNSVRPTIISPGDTWMKKAQKALLATPTTTSLGSDEQKSEKDAAFDLLDALTKSGALPVEHASLHIVIAATHCFDKTVTETVVQDNVNPIDKVERSTLIMASTVHQLPPAALIRENQFARVKNTSPILFLEDGSA